MKYQISKARDAGYVTRAPGEYMGSNQYWRWCTCNAVPFVVVEFEPKAKYAFVELDLYNTADEGFSAKAGYNILQRILGQPLKPKSNFYMSPILIQAHVAINSAEALAKYLFQCAVDEGICLSQEELIQRTLTRLGSGECVKAAFIPFECDVYPSSLAIVRTREFWDQRIRKHN